MVVRVVGVMVRVAATAGRGVAVVVQMLGFGRFAVFAAIAFEQRASGERIVAGATVEDGEDLRLEAEVLTEREGDLRILLLQPFELAGDAFDQHTGKEIDRNHADLRHAELDLALHDRLQSRPG